MNPDEAHRTRTPRPAGGPPTYWEADDGPPPLPTTQRAAAPSARSRPMTHMERWAAERDGIAGPRPSRTKGLDCPQCDGSMKKATITGGVISGLIMALITFTFGVALFVCWPVFGWIIGGLLCLYALTMGGRRRKVWKCRECGYVFDRA